MEDSNKFVWTLILTIFGYAFMVASWKTILELWKLSPITSIGFAASIAIAGLKGHLTIDNYKRNFRILGFIFAGTVMSYAATALAPYLSRAALAGDIVGAATIGLVMILVWFKGHQINGKE